MLTIGLACHNISIDMLSETFSLLRARSLFFIVLPWVAARQALKDL